MAILHHGVTIRILDGDVSLTRSDIVEGTLQIDSAPVDTKIFAVDYAAGTIRRIDQEENSSWRQQHNIEYDYNEMMKDTAQLRRERFTALFNSVDAIVALYDHMENIDSTNYNRVVNEIAQIRIDIPDGTEEPHDFNVV
jgi:hypothetical protein